MCDRGSCGTWNSLLFSQKTSNHAPYNNCIYGRYRGGLCPFYMINVNISKCIAFYGGWDCGMVANSARWIFEGGELGYDDYYTIYSNNIPITWLLYKLYCFSSGMKAYPYNPEFIWIQFQCVMLSLAVLCSVLLVLRVSKNLGTSVITLISILPFWESLPGKSFRIRMAAP